MTRWRQLVILHAVGRCWRRRGLVWAWCVAPASRLPSTPLSASAHWLSLSGPRPITARSLHRIRQTIISTPKPGSGPPSLPLTLHLHLHMHLDPGGLDDWPRRIRQSSCVGTRLLLVLLLVLLKPSVQPSLQPGRVAAFSRSLSVLSCLVLSCLLFCLSLSWSGCLLSATSTCRPANHDSHWHLPSRHLHVAVHIIRSVH